MKVVINADFGGFSLSGAAILAMRARGNEHAKNEVLYGETYPDGQLNDFKSNSYGRDIPRTDADLVAVVEALGEEADGRCARLVVVEIPDGIEWQISEYDGMEHVAECHRTWP